MNGQSSTRRRRRMRSSAEQMYWDQLTPTERLAFTLGYVVGQGVDFPSPAQIGALRIQLGIDRPPTPARGGATGDTLQRRPVARNADGTPFTYDLAEVARIATHAVLNGVSTATAVYEQIEQCASPKAAKVAISRARKAGYYIPASRTGRKPRGAT